MNIKASDMKKMMGALLALLMCMPMAAQEIKYGVIQTSCNYQHGDMAIVDGKARVSWQVVDICGFSIPEAYQIIVTERFTGRVVYDSGRVISKESQLVELPPLPSNEYGYKWKVRQWNLHDKGPTPWSREQVLRVVDENTGRGAQWIGAISKKDARIPEGRWSNADFKKDEFKRAWADVDTLSSKSIVLQKVFQARRRVVDAVVYVSGLGHYEMSINGSKVGDSEFAPLWSEYSKTVYYNVYDVTDMLRQGGNDIHVLLGNGMFNVQRMGRYTKLQTSFGAPQLWLCMKVSYDDGTYLWRRVV